MDELKPLVLFAFPDQLPDVAEILEINQAQLVPEHPVGPAGLWQYRIDAIGGDYDEQP